MMSKDTIQASSGRTLISGRSRARNPLQSNDPASYRTA